MRYPIMVVAISLQLATAAVAAQSERVGSPDGRIEVRVDLGEALKYSISYDGKVVMPDMGLSLTLGDGTDLGAQPKLLNAERREVSQQLRPVYGVKNAVVPDHFNELALTFEGGYQLLLRVYDDAVAYRWVTSLPGRIRVKAEEVRYQFADDVQALFPEEESFLTHSERLYRPCRTSEIKPEQFASLPLLVKVPDGPTVVLTEADLHDYPGLYLCGTQGRGLTGRFPAVAVEEKQTNDRTVAVAKRADYLAETAGTRSFPWRVTILADEDKQLLENETVYKLSPDCALEDTSWIKPGKVAWDWWNANNLYGVDFPAGINTATYKYYIDFASQYGIEYVILDEGWYKIDGNKSDLLSVVPEIDMKELSRHAEQKGVKLILWVTWKALEDQLDEALDQFQKWGAAGVKVDFMQRDDQWMVGYYERIAREAARRHLLVDFHGAYSPKGLRRKYPNVVTREGVKGLENCKWSDEITPEHNVTLPFIRMVAGPMDYTPGAMHNALGKNFFPRFERPMSQNTRCQELAKYVVFESPLQMLADSPSNYLREPECMQFLAGVPSVWDETIALDGKVGDYVVMARRSGRDWYLGAMTDTTARSFKVDLSFLPPGRYEATIYRDGLNADRQAQDFQKVVETVSPTDRLILKLASGGGWAARLTPTE